MMPTAGPSGPELLPQRSLQPPFPRVVPILERDKGPLEWSKQRKAEQDRHRNPDDQMHVGRWVHQRFEDERQYDHDGRYDKDDKDRRPVAAIGKGEIETTRFAARRHLQEPRKQPALAAARTTAGQPTHKRRWRRQPVGHASLQNS